jgi:hypothetical protein
MDQGGKLYHNPKVCALFEEFGTPYIPPAPTPHTRTDPLNMPTKPLAMPFAVSFLVPISLPSSGPMPSKNISKSRTYYPARTTVCLPTNGTKPNFTLKLTFDCHVWVHPPGKQSAHLHQHALKASFLATSRTLATTYSGMTSNTNVPKLHTMPVSTKA